MKLYKIIQEIENKILLDEGIYAMTSEMAKMAAPLSYQLGYYNGTKDSIEQKIRENKALLEKLKKVK